MSEAAKDELFGWRLRTIGPLDVTCDGCAEHKPCRYEWPETEAWLCEECWRDATEIDRVRDLAGRLAEALRDFWRLHADYSTHTWTDVHTRVAAVLAEWDAQRGQPQ